MPRQDLPQSSDDNGDQTLDELIARALAGDGEPLRLERLQQFWDRQSRRRRRRSLLTAMTAAAASLLFAGWLIGGRRTEAPPSPAHVVEQPLPSPRGLASAAPDDGMPTTKPAASLAAGRPPTDYERLMFFAQTRSPQPRRTPDELLTEAIDRLTANPQADVRDLTADLLASDGADPVRHDWQAKLLAELPDSAGARRVAVCRLLAVYGSERATPALLQVAARAGHPAEVLDAIEAIAGVDRWPAIARQAPDSRTRQAIAQRLLRADAEGALLAFVAMINDETLRSDALAAARDEQQLPVPRLLALLDHEQAWVRLAAARTLGETSRCEMTEALIARIRNRPSGSKEAWFALLASQCEAADEFVARAARDPHLLGQLNNARLQWSRTIQ